MAFPEDLETIKKDDFEKVWKIVEECGEEERHFNQLQSIYRGVASTWLLATFAAVGYLLFVKEGQPSHPGVAAVVCFAGAFGIALIWILDLHVYHRLLVAVFEEGRKLEGRFAFLPRFRTNMYNIGGEPGGGDRIRKRLAWYYVGTTSAPITAGIFLWGMLFHSKHYRCEWYSFLLLAAVIACLAILWLFRRTTEKQ
jgi:Na+/melibiose symporter-like transporter